MRFGTTRLGVGSGAGVLAAALVTLLAQGTAQAQISAVVTESGRITLSVDAVGTNLGPTTIQVNKPVGASVRGAYLAAASYGNYTIPNGDIILNGNAISWDLSVFNDVVSIPMFFNNVFADVTSDVALLLNTAPPGIVNVPISEVNTFPIDGAILAVIWDDLVNVPATESNGVILLFGGQALSGDTFFINLAQPLDLSSSSVRADLSLGISFGFQDAAPTGQESHVDVNGNRMTTAAGGEDDGASENGALITVGGFNDSNTNPANPNASSTNQFDDDELYSLLPYYVANSTLITVDTFNPSNDDNIFFGAVNTSVPAITQGIQLTPVNATNPLGSSHTVTATVIDSQNNPVQGVLVSFLVTAGPNAGANGTDTTDSAGQATFTYSGFTVGRDTIQASFVDSQGNSQVSNTCNKMWVEQCLLAVGAGPGAANFTPADHTFTLQLSDVAHWQPVLLSNFGKITVPLPDEPLHLNAGAPFSGGIRPAHAPVSKIVKQLAAQVVMWNPADMPQLPEQFTPGLLVWVLADGDIIARPYGRSTGMTLTATREYFPGGPGSPRRVVIRFPFTIPGF